LLLLLVEVVVVVGHWSLVATLNTVCTVAGKPELFFSKYIYY
jgi:hypothetical protein